MVILYTININVYTTQNELPFIAVTCKSPFTEKLTFGVILEPVCEESKAQDMRD